MFSGSENDGCLGTEGVFNKGLRWGHCLSSQAFGYVAGVSTKKALQVSEITSARKLYPVPDPRTCLHNPPDLAWGGCPVACAPGAAAAPPLPRCWLAGGAASPPRHRGLVGASAPPPHHGLAPPGEVAPSEGAGSWCWAPPAATSSAPSSSPLYVSHTYSLQIP